MQAFYKFLIFALLLIHSCAYASGFFVEGLEWRATETNNWAYINSLTVPQQTLDYKTINFHYSPGIRLGGFYEKDNTDLLLAFTNYFTSTSSSATGNIRPAFLGSVTAIPPGTVYFYNPAQVKQTIKYSIIDLDLGKAFYPTEIIRLHPLLGLMGGWINQTISAQYQGSISSDENITNNFKGIGPKFGIDADVNLFTSHNTQTSLFSSIAASYLAGEWNVKDITNVNPYNDVFVFGSNPRMGVVTLQGSIGFKFNYKKLQIKLAYEISDWRDQVQFFDNDTGAHNNDLILQGLTLGAVFRF